MIARSIVWRGSPVVRRPRLWLSERAQAAIEDAARRAHPAETGGVLVGVYGDNGRPWVVEAVEVPSAHVDPTYYELPAGARPDVVDTARVRDRRLGYVGDWHSHPADVGPSETDIATMKEVAEDAGGDCDHPVLVIARRVDEAYRLDGREFARRRLRKLRLIAAGDLPGRGDAVAGVGYLPRDAR
jgi:proteasome lid subunit RPN8/RPN11